MPPTSPLQVTIIGAGLGGLATAISMHRQGFSIQIFEQADKFQRLGDSIGFGPNAARLFNRWGVGKRMYEISSKARGIVMHKFHNSEEVIGVDDELSKDEERYGARSMIGHRGDFHMILYDFVTKDLGINVRMGCRIERYDESKPSVVTPDGQEIVSDVVVCCDGVRSLGRNTVLGIPDQAVSSGYAVYRCFMNGDLLKDDPLVGKWIDGGDSIHLFLGTDMHGFVTVLRDGRELNAVLTHKDDFDVEESWNAPGRREDVLALIDGWDPAFRRVWEKVPGPNLIDWKLVYRPCLPKWVSDSGLVTLMGDAAHPFIPTSTQGASQAVEDGATLALCLAKAGKGNVPLALHSFFQMRRDYVAKAQETGITQRELWHNMQDKDTKEFKEEFDPKVSGMQNYYLWKNDAEETCERLWPEVSKRVMASSSQ